MKLHKIAVAICTAAALSACGGGGGGGGSPPAAGVVSPGSKTNHPPVAGAGPVQNVLLGSVVTLDAGTSSDPENDQLTYAWKLTGKPTGSIAELDSPTSAKPKFTADLAGVYIVSLTVNDGTASSEVATTTITATRPGPTWETVSATPTNVERMGVQSSGKLVLGGWEGTTGARFRFSMRRVNIDGSIDGSFGNNGLVATGVGVDNAYMFKLAVQSDDKIIGVGQANTDNGFVLALARYTKDGQLDTTFGQQGIVQASAPAGFDTFFPGRGVALQPDGKILAFAEGRTGSSYVNSVAVFRFNQDGSLDTAFGTNGHLVYSVSNNLPASPSDIRVAADGKIYLAGIVSDVMSHGFVARFLPNGTLDMSYGTSGQVVFDSALEALALQPDGKAIVTGYHSSDPDTSGVSVIRLNSDGTLDTGFGTSGRAFFDLGVAKDVGNSVLIDSTGRPVIAGLILQGNGFADKGFVMRLQTNGARDDSFGEQGVKIARSGLIAFGLALDAFANAYIITGGDKVERVPLN
jgi:uncharacterized delta-60 repeat protein